MDTNRGDLNHDISGQVPGAHPWVGGMRQFLREERGAVMMEYVVLVALMAITTAPLVQPFSDAIKTFAQDIFIHLALP